MELVTTDPAENEVKKASNLELIDAMFEQLLEDSCLTKEIQLTPKFSMTIKTLSTQELLNADTLYIATVSGVPKDVVDRVRTVSTLSYAVTHINGRPLYSPDDEQENRITRDRINAKLMNMPPTLIDRVSEAYRKLLDEQIKLYENVDGNIENF